MPFANTKAERMAGGDERPAIQERYRSLDDYVARVRTCGEQLVAERLLLPADADVYVQEAKACKAFAPVSVSAAAAK